MSIYFEELQSHKSFKKYFNNVDVSTDLSTGENMIYETQCSKEMDNKIVFEEVFRFLQIYDPREIIINTKNCSITENKFKLHLELDNRVYYFYEDSNNHYHNINYQTQFLKKVFPNTGIINSD